MANNLKPYVNIGPGDFIKEEIEFRNWSQQDLANIIDISYQHLSDIVNNKKQITFDLARKLSQVFEQSAQYWLNLSNNYQLRLSENLKASELIAQKKHIHESLPVSELVRMQWLPKQKDPKFMAAAMKLVNAMESNVNSQEPILAFRKSEAYSKYNSDSAMFWFKIAQKCSEKMTIGNFNKSDLENIASEITNYTLVDDGISKFLGRLKEIGVKFFVLTHLKKTYLDGASFYDQDNPVIVYTKRYNRIDNFWFTIAHEIGHILLHFDEKSEFYLDDIETKSTNEKELEADNYATKILRLDDIVNFFEKYFKVSDKNILNSVSKLGVHASIISGALKHKGILSQKRMNKVDYRVDSSIPKTCYPDFPF